MSVAIFSGRLIVQLSKCGINRARRISVEIALGTCMYLFGFLVRFQVKFTKCYYEVHESQIIIKIPFKMLGHALSTPFKAV